MPSSQHPLHAGIDLRNSAHGNWLRSERFSDFDFEYFTKSRCKLPNICHAAPKYQLRKDIESAKIGSQWVYKFQSNKIAIGWAELQIFPGKYFDRGELFFAADQIPNDLIMDALCSLITIVFTANPIDQLMIHTRINTQENSQRISSLGGKIEKILSFASFPWHPDSHPIHESYGVSLDRASWKKSPESLMLKDNLKKIEKYKASKKRVSSAPKTKKRSILARIFRPKIDDSIF